MAGKSAQPSHSPPFQGEGLSELTIVSGWRDVGLMAGESHGVKAPYLTTTTYQGGGDKRQKYLSNKLAGHTYNGTDGADEFKSGMHH